GAAHALVVARGVAPAVQVRLLRHLLGLRAVAQHSYGEPERAHRGGVVPLGEGALVPATGPRQELGQVRGGRPTLLRGLVGHRPDVAHSPILASSDATVSVCHCPAHVGFGADGVPDGADGNGRMPGMPDELVY